MIVKDALSTDMRCYYRKNIKPKEEEKVNKFKRSVILLVVLAMCFSGLWACGQKEEATEPAKTETETEKEEAVEGEETVDVADMPVVKYMMYGDPQDDDETVEAELNKILAEKYGIQIDIEAIPTGEYNDRIGLVITSGEDYDICFTSSWCNSFVDNVAREAFLPLNELLETEAGQTLKAALPEWITAAATVNGNVYAIPNMQSQVFYNGYYVQKDLAEKYGLDPATVTKPDDIAPFLEQIKENEPDYYGIRCAGGVEVLDVLIPDGMDPITINENQAFAGWGVEFDDDTFTAVAGIESDAVKTSFKRMNDWYHAGYVRSDIASVVDDTGEQLSGVYAVEVANAIPAGLSAFEATRGIEYIVLPVAEPIVRSTAPTSTMLAVNANTKNPEAAIKFLCAINTDVEVYNTLLYGVEGVHYNKIDDLYVEQIADSGYARNGYDWAYGKQFNSWLVEGMEADIWEKTEALNNSAAPSKLLGFVFDGAPVQAELAQLQSVADEYKTELIYTDDFEGVWAECQEKLEAAGLAKVGEELQKQIDAWK